MAFLISASFPDDDEGQALHGKVRKALNTLTKTRPPEEEGLIPYYQFPVNLKKKSQEHLKESYQDIWTWCMFSFDQDETGASILVSKREIKIGPFFLRKGFTSVDMEKIILHEYLHAGLRYDRQFHHSFIQQIITYDLGYKGAGILRKEWATRATTVRNCEANEAQGMYPYQTHSPGSRSAPLVG